MAMTPMEILGFLLTSYVFFCIVISANAQFAKKTYVIQMDKSATPDTFSNPLEWYSSKVKSAILPNTLESDMENEDRIIYSYQTAFRGVAAKLSREEAEKLKSEDGVIAIFPDTRYQLHTTRSPSFLRLEPSQSTKNVWSDNLADHDVIVGVLDTGIWPESESFNDKGMRPVPAHWKGACETGRGFTKQHCNRKIVGARVFYGETQNLAKLDNWLGDLNPGPKWEKVNIPPLKAYIMIEGAEADKTIVQWGDIAET